MYRDMSIVDPSKSFVLHIPGPRGSIKYHSRARSVYGSQKKTHIDFNSGKFIVEYSILALLLDQLESPLRCTVDRPLVGRQWLDCLDSVNAEL
jgi:hypothetical protein